VGIEPYYCTYNYLILNAILEAKNDLFTVCSRFLNLFLKKRIQLYINFKSDIIRVRKEDGCS